MNPGPVLNVLLWCMEFLTAVVILVSTFFNTRDEFLQRKVRSADTPSPHGEPKAPPTASPMDEGPKPPSLDDVMQ